MPPWIRRWTCRLIAFTFVVGCTGVALHAFGYLHYPYNPRNPFHVSFATGGWAVPAHFFGAGLALLLAPIQLAARLRVRWPALHRTAGWLYVFAVTFGGISGLLLAPRSQGHWSNAISFCLLATLWLASTTLALRHALARRHEAHRRWMLRSVALTFAAVSLRIHLVLGIGVFRLDFATAYSLAIWLCWTANLLLMEWYLRRQDACRHGRDMRSASRQAVVGTRH